MATLFDLHRTAKTFKISDGDTEITVMLTAPTQASNARLMTSLNDARMEAEEDAEKRGLLETFKQNGARWSKEELIQLVLRMEIGPVEEEADLAPTESTEPSEIVPGLEQTRDEDAELLKQEREATRKRQDRRRAILEEMPDPDLVQLHAELSLRLAIMAQASGKFMNAQLVEMVREPETGRRIFTDEEFDDKGEPNANFIGNLMPATSDQLDQARQDFLAELSEKNIRKQAERADFLQSGKSGKKRRGSRGGMGQIRRISPAPPSDSSAAVSGSTTSPKL